MESLDSRCKECKRKEQADYRASQNKEAIRIATNKRQADWRQRRRDGKELFDEERDKQFPVEPLRTWLLQYGKDTGLDWASIARRAELEESTVRHITSNHRKIVRLSTIDSIGVACGVPNLVDLLYPVGSKEIAA